MIKDGKQWLTISWLILKQWLMITSSPQLMMANEVNGRNNGDRTSSGEGLMAANGG